MDNKILIVDDDENIRESFKINLNHLYDVYFAHDGFEGLEIIKKDGPFSVIISDYNMPKLNGLAFLTMVKKLAPDSIRVILTGFADTELAIDAVNEGNVFRFLCKPHPIAKLIKNIDACIHQYQLITAEKKLNVLKEKFLQIISHEYKTPLTHIQLSSTLLEDYYNIHDDENFFKCTNEISKNVQFMNKLLEEVLAMDGISKDKMAYNPSILNLIELIYELIETHKSIDQGNHDVLFKYDNENLLIESDEKLIKHVLNNLISNALKYSHLNSEVKIEIQSNEKEVKISVIDKGIGIPDAEKKYLFEPFHRCSNATNYKGTGLGMMIIKKALDTLNWGIEIDSQMEIGTTIQLKFNRG